MRWCIGEDSSTYSSEAPTYPSTILRWPMVRNPDSSRDNFSLRWCHCKGRTILCLLNIRSHSYHMEDLNRSDHPQAMATRCRSDSQASDQYRATEAIPFQQPDTSNGENQPGIDKPAISFWGGSYFAVFLDSIPPWA